MDRILAATEALLEERLFEQVSVQDIVRRARTSVGAFYARFPTKEALLPALYDRYDAGLPRTVADLRVVPVASLGERVRQVVERIVDVFSRQRGLLRAMAIHARVAPDAIPAPAREARRALHESVGDLLLEFQDEIRHPDPRIAVDLGQFMVAATLRDKLLFGDAPHAAALGDLSREQLTDELSRALFTYLRGPGDDVDAAGTPPRTATGDR